MRSAVIVFPGINRERDMAYALKRATGREPVVVWHRDNVLPDVDLVVLPGGFSYGDYLRPGAIAARSPIMADLVRKAQSGVSVLGVCNGFQILCEAGLLPGALMRNAGMKFICRTAHLAVENTQTRFTHRYAPGQVVRFPLAHGDGNYFADAETLARLEGEGQVVFRYCSESGAVEDESNPNGSVNGIAGIVSQAGNVLGLMPHPENHLEPVQGGPDGLSLFESLATALEPAA